MLKYCLIQFAFLRSEGEVSVDRCVPFSESSNSFRSFFSRWGGRLIAHRWPSLRSINTEATFCVLDRWASLCSYYKCLYKWVIVVALFIVLSAICCVGGRGGELVYITVDHLRSTCVWWWSIGLKDHSCHWVISWVWSNESMLNLLDSIWHTRQICTCVVGIHMCVCVLMFLVIVYRFIYETERHNGVAELLEILGR